MNRRSSGYFAAALSAFCFICPALVGCSLPTSGVFPITVRSLRITLEWDPPTQQFPSPSLLVSRYRVYFRPHGSYSWQLIKEIPATGSPSLQLEHADFGDGSFDFAVSAITASGGESPFHTSLDASADPYGGWFLNWILTN
jgi:hypothetical protein